MQSFKLVKNSEKTKSKMLIFCTVSIFALILMTFGISFVCWIDDKMSHFRRVLCALELQISDFKFSNVMQQYT